MYHGFQSGFIMTLQKYTQICVTEYVDFYVVPFSELVEWAPEHEVQQADFQIIMFYSGNKNLQTELEKYSIRDWFCLH